jgi:hypothetical protein
MMPLLACGAGIYAGFSFNVFGLMPLSVFLGAATLLSGQGAFGGDHVLLLSLIAVQAGYMIGLTGRDTFAQLGLQTNPDQPKQF